MEVEERGGGKVCALIEKATNSIAPEVDPRLLKSIKSLVRDSESELRLASQTLMSLMKRDHSQVRFLALLIIDELFMRSKLFRTILVVNLDQLLSLSIGFRRNLPLPAPPAVASLLRSKAIEFLEKWNVSFGIHYRQLRLGFEYLKNILRFQFPNLQENAARAQRERREREIRSKELILNKFEILKANLPSIKNDIQSTVDEIRECLDIVSSKEEGMLLDTMEDEETEEFRCFELRQIRLDSLKEGEKIHESSENKAVFDTLRELYKLLVTKHLVSLQEWISILIRVDLTDNRFRDSTLKEFIDIRNHLQSVKKMCEETGCALPNTSDQEEEDIWEEGKMEHFQDVNTLPISNQTEDLAIPSTSEVPIPSTSEVNSETPKCSSKESKSTDSDLTCLRGKLLAEAPVMPWGSFLDNWGSDRAFLANQRGLELKGHWGRVDEDAVIPAEKIAELNLQTSLYKEEPMKIKPCHAPLGNGRLCQRRDLRVCPFHGPIIPRDNSPVGCMDPDVDTAVAERLAKQAVKNIRDKDKEELKTREYDKQSLKRAKLVKVREHNDAVLREAGLTSTSRSAAVGEDMVTLDGEKLSAKNKTQTLAAMLRKKVTSKDRISQRLSNTRARDATGKQQLTLGEDSNYREAFPNQW